MSSCLYSFLFLILCIMTENTDIGMCDREIQRYKKLLEFSYLNNEPVYISVKGCGNYFKCSKVID